MNPKPRSRIIRTTVPLGIERYLPAERDDRGPAYEPRHKARTVPPTLKRCASPAAEIAARRRRIYTLRWGRGGRRRLTRSARAGYDGPTCWLYVYIIDAGGDVARR